MGRVRNIGHCAVLFSILTAAAHAFAGATHPAIGTRLPRHWTSGTSAAAVASTKSESSSSSSSSSAEGVEAKGQESPPQPTDTRELLDSALGRDGESAASELLDRIAQLRNSGGDQGKEVEQFLDKLLSSIDGDDGRPVRFPLWTCLRPLARFSRRARRASLRRVLDLSTPAAEETDGGSTAEEAAEAVKRSRRRSFVVLLRSLAGTAEDDGSSKGRAAPSILSLERAARREAREGATYEDMVTRLPPGLETPDYTVVARRRPAGKKGAAYEIRRYEAFSVCTVPMTKSRPADAARTDARVSNPQLSGASSFGALAGYLFGKNSESRAMKMTTPVLTTGDGDDRTMSFVLPSDYWDEDGEARAPQPLDGSGVRLGREPGGYRAALMFGGYASSKTDVERRKAQLLEGVQKDGEYDIVEGAPVSLAQYNDPFTPPWKRRNEVAVPVVARQEQLSTQGGA